MNQQMNPQLLFALGVEVALIFFVLMFLVQPRLLFGNAGPRVRRIFMLIGQILLCVLFCWSIILGCIMYMSGISLTVGNE